ncbi:hypothetical protein [Mycoplasma suis]|nr:hypothetical protein [Mycoplasma suis]
MKGLLTLGIMIGSGSAVTGGYVFSNYLGEKNKGNQISSTTPTNSQKQSQKWCSTKIDWWNGNTFTRATTYC